MMEGLGKVQNVAFYAIHLITMYNQNLNINKQH